MNYNHVCLQKYIIYFFLYMLSTCFSYFFFSQRDVYIAVHVFGG